MVSSDFAAPYVFEANGRWIGNDGNWSTFSIGIGTPPQYFDLLPSTVSSEIWVPDRDGCSWSPPWLDCGALRGVEATTGTQSNGFETNISSSWDVIGLYGLAAENNLYGSHNNTGEYGQDTVTLGTSRSQTIPQQLVASIATADFWLGVLGLGDIASSFSVRESNPQSLLFSMKALGMVPSMSYGYTAGASYSASVASLIGGGYDQAAVESNGVQFAIDSSNASSLPVTLKSLLVTDSPTGTISAPISEVGIEMSVDSTVSQLWLPGNICDALAMTLGLTFDATTELYSVNTSARQNLLQHKPQLTFTLTANISSKESVNIVLPYAAFDLRAYLPFYNVSTPYFPIRRAANESQFVLGRTFLQEAYLVVDWERQNFTLGQVIHSPKTTNVVAIPPVEIPGPGGGLTTKAITGLVVGVLAGVVILGVLTWLWRKFERERSIQPVHPHEGHPVQVEQSDIHEMDVIDHHELRADSRQELGSTDVFELFEERRYKRLTSSAMYELNARRSAQELEAGWL